MRDIRAVNNSDYSISLKKGEQKHFTLKNVLFPRIIDTQSFSYYLNLFTCKNVQ
jgi:hypothetical protein